MHCSDRASEPSKTVLEYVASTGRLKARAQSREGNSRREIVNRLLMRLNEYYLYACISKSCILDTAPDRRLARRQRDSFGWFELLIQYQKAFGFW